MGIDIDVNHRDGALGSFTMATALPAAALRAHVRRYCGYTEHTKFTSRREAASTTIPMIINLGPPLALRLAGGPSRHYSVGFLGGPSDSAGIVDSGGHQYGLQVDFTPVGAQLFLRMPLHGCTNRVTSLPELLGDADARRLIDRLRCAPDWASCFAMLDEFIASRFAVAALPPADLVWAWRRLSETNGNLPVAELARELSCSRKHLTGRFTTHFGLAPKTISRILRFQAVVRTLNLGGETNLAAIAARLGYYDQPHLARDFRQFSGITATQHAQRASTGFGIIEDLPSDIYTSQPSDTHLALQA